VVEEAFFDVDEVDFEVVRGEKLLAAQLKHPPIIITKHNSNNYYKSIKR